MLATEPSDVRAALFTVTESQRTSTWKARRPNPGHDGKQRTGVKGRDLYVALGRWLTKAVSWMLWDYQASGCSHYGVWLTTIAQYSHHPLMGSWEDVGLRQALHILYSTTETKLLLPSTRLGDIHGLGRSPLWEEGAQDGWYLTTYTFKTHRGKKKSIFSGLIYIVYQNTEGSRSLFSVVIEVTPHPHFGTRE